MREFIEDTAPDQLVPEVVEALNYASDHFREVRPEEMDVYFLIFQLPLRLEENSAPYAEGMREVSRALQRIVERHRQSGAGSAELFFMNVAGLYTKEFGTGERIFALRAIHRRAAELGLLDDPTALSVRAAIAEHMRGLADQGLHDDAVRAGADTIAEAEGANVALNDWSLFNHYAEVLALAGRGDEAEAAFRRAYEIIEGVPVVSLKGGSAPTRITGERARNLQFVANQWAFYLNILGRFEAAEEPARYAAEWSEQLFGRDHISTQKSRYNFAVTLLGQGNAAEALPYFEEALPLQRAEEARRTMRPLIGRQKDTVLLLTTLARAQVQVPGREADALAAAIEAADKVRDLRDRRLRGGGRDEAADPGAAALAKAVARSERRDPLSPAYDMVLLAGWVTREGPDGNIDDAFRAAQDLTLTEAGSAISQAAARRLAGEGELGQLVRRRQDTAAAIVRVNDDYRSAAVGTDSTRLAELSAELGGLGDDLAAIDYRLAAEFPEYGDLVAPASVGFEAVRSALGADEALVMMLPSEGHHYVFVITREAAVWHRATDGAAEIGELVARLRCRMDEATCSPEELDTALFEEDKTGPQPIDSFYPRYDQAAAFQLYQRLLAPVETALAGKRVVYTVAAGPISGLPLAALVTGNPSREDAQSGEPEALRNAPWLGLRHAFVTLPSVSAITLPRPAANAVSGGLVGYGAPVLDGSGSGSDAPASRGTARDRRRGGTTGLRAASFFEASDGNFKVDPEKLRRLDPLPGTERELSMLARSLEGGAAGLRLGSNATEAAVKRDPALASASVVVFATHGLLPGEMGQAAEPGLVLTPPQTATENDDGLLTASEAAALDLRARWLILSACNTATPGGGQGAEALSGLARAFLYAGADSLLASHWRVSDDASAALTVQTVGAGLSGLTQAEALQAAQNAVRSGTGFDGTELADWAPYWAHPAAWAPFTLITDYNR